MMLSVSISTANHVMYVFPILFLPTGQIEKDIIDAFKVTWYDWVFVGCKYALFL